MTGATYGAGIRTAGLAAVGMAALVAGVLTGHGQHDGFLLAAAGGFALGIAAAHGLADLRTDRRAEGRRSVDRDPTPARNHDDLSQGQGVAAVARSTVAAVAHDMSNPLASLKSNLEWLRDALEEGRLEAPEDQAEAREVLRDAREAAERLRVDVGALRAAGRGEDPQAHPPVQSHG
jgi:signal transduction histidine kinase